MSGSFSSLRVILQASAAPELLRAAESLVDVLRCETLRPCRLIFAEALTAEDRRFEGLTLLTDPAQIDRMAVEPGEPIPAAGEGDRIVIRHLKTPVGLCVLAWGNSPSSAQRALAIIGEYLGLRVFPWGRVVVASHDERDLVSADLVLQARHQTRGLAPVRMTDRQTWTRADIESYTDFAAWNGYNLLAWPCRIGSAMVPVRAGLARFQESTAKESDAGGDNCALALEEARQRGLQTALIFDPLQLPPEMLDVAPPADLHPGGLAIQPFSEIGQTLYRHMVAALYSVYQPGALVLAMSELPWRPGSQAEVGKTPDSLAFHAQLLAIYGPNAVPLETELYLQAAAAVAEAARFLELDLPVVLLGRGLAHLVGQQHQVLADDTWLCPTPAADLVSLADQLTRQAARGAPVFFDHLQSSHREVWSALTVDETFLGDSPRVRSLDTILGAWLRVPMQGMLMRHSRLHGCDENLLYTAQAVWGEIPGVRRFYAELSTALYGTAAETMARARQGQEEIEAVSSVHDLGLESHDAGSSGASGAAAAQSAQGSSFAPVDMALGDGWNPEGAAEEEAESANASHEPPAVHSLRRIVADLLDRMPLAVETLPADTFLLSFLRDLSSRNVRLAGILQAVEGSLSRADLLSVDQVERVKRSTGRLTAKLEMGRFARAVMTAALLCRRAAENSPGGLRFGASPAIDALAALHQALLTLRKSPPSKIIVALKEEHTCDQQATCAVVEQTLIAPWQALVARLERILGPQIARRQSLGTMQEMLEPREIRGGAEKP